MFFLNIFFARCTCTVFQECSPTKPQKGAWPARGDRPQRERVSVIEPQNSWRKRALNTSAAFKQRRPASTAARALNDGHEGKANQFTPWYVFFFPFKNVILYLWATCLCFNISLMCSVKDLISRNYDLHGTSATYPYLYLNVSYVKQFCVIRTFDVRVVWMMRFVKLKIFNQSCLSVTRDYECLFRFYNNDTCI